MAVLLYRQLRYGCAFRRIPLSRGKHALVDLDDYERLSRYKWHTVGDRGTFYAARNTGQRRGLKRVVVKMHREVLKVPAGMFVDHINHNGLDNRKANLRPATQAQNARNRRKVQRGNVHSIYKGLTWYRREERWAVRVMVNRKSKFIGYFDNELNAARAYDQAARKYHGQFASLNFPDETKNERSLP
ncbi:MAG: HNH endonuclease [Phycisphaerales bacterium]|nr:MAG: HNH endonuclease [Phycisphaerales bacterium]